MSMLRKIGVAAAGIMAGLMVMACGESPAPAAEATPAPVAEATAAPTAEATAAPATAAPAAADTGDKPMIRFADALWESLWINNAIAGFIITHGYGYPVEQIPGATAVARQSLANGDVDVFMEMWQHLWPEYYDEQTAAGNIVNLGTTVEDGSQFFIIPQWMHEEYGITTIEDMKGEVVVDGTSMPAWELFQDPEDPTKGLFVNCVIGWECQKLNDEKLQAYGLTEYYNSLYPGSGGFDAALAGPQKKREPVFAYLWAPHYLVASYDWHILEEPAYSTACWEGTDPNTPRYGCAYETLPLDIGAHKGLLEKAPDVVAMLRRMTVGLGPLNETAAWANENDIQGEWELAAIHFLQNYEDRWTTWVEPDKVDLIKAAIEAAAS